MLTKKGDQQGNLDPRIIDFDPSWKLNAGKPTYKPYYMAPEMFKDKYSDKSDTWSLGVLMYKMISGHFPFYSEQHSEIIFKIK